MQQNRGAAKSKEEALVQDTKKRNDNDNDKAAAVNA
jgi:hypothetical protein